LIPLVINNSNQMIQIITKLLMEVKIKVTIQTTEIKKDIWIKVNIPNKILFLVKDRAQIACKKCHKMLQVDQVELWTLELTCTSNLIIINSSNKFNKVLINKILQEELEIGNQ
jgi:hypothetical protein